MSKVLKFYYYLNDSHHYILPQPAEHWRLQNERYRDILPQIAIHTMKIRPVFVNCTLAPLAEQCANSSTTLIKVVNESLTTPLTPKSSIQYQSFTSFPQQHQQYLIVLVISILLMFILLQFILCLLYKLFYIKKKRTLEKSLEKPTVTDDSMFMHYVDRDSFYSDQITITNEVQNIDNSNKVNTYMTCHLFLCWFSPILRWLIRISTIIQ